MTDAIPPNMTAQEYNLLKKYRENIPALTESQLKELKRLNALSISHLQFNYPGKA